MKLLIKQRIFTLTDNYYVYEESGDIRYEVESALFSLGHQIHVYDARTRQKVGCIRQKPFAFLPTFEIEIQGQIMGTIRKRFTLFRQSYEVDYRGWDVDGDFLGRDYQVMQGSLEIMSISKEVLSWSDTYTLRYNNPANEVPGLLLVLAIDAANCSHND